MLRGKGMAMDNGSIRRTQAFFFFVGPIDAKIDKKNRSHSAKRYGSPALHTDRRMTRPRRRTKRSVGGLTAWWIVRKALCQRHPTCASKALRSVPVGNEIVQCTVCWGSEVLLAREGVVFGLDFQS